MVPGVPFVSALLCPKLAWTEVTELFLGSQEGASEVGEGMEATLTDSSDVRWTDQCGLDWKGRDGTKLARQAEGGKETRGGCWIVDPGLKPPRTNKEKAPLVASKVYTVYLVADTDGRGNKSAISTRISWAGQTSAKPKEGNSGDHAGIKLSMIGRSLCGDSRRPSIHLRDEGEPVPVTQAAAGPHSRQRRTGLNRTKGSDWALPGLPEPDQSVLCGACVSRRRLVRADKLVWASWGAAKEDWEVKRCQSHAAPLSRGGSSGWLAVSYLSHSSSAEKTTQRNHQDQQAAVGAPHGRLPSSD